MNYTARMLMSVYCVGDRLQYHSHELSQIKTVFGIKYLFSSHDSISR